jgi:signal transduction histidine kinase
MVENGGAMHIPVIQAFGLLIAFLAGAALTRILAARKASGSSPDPVQGLEIPSRTPPAAESGYLLFGHEMKNYLCVLKGNAKLLRQRAGSQDLAAILDRIDRVVERLETFVWKEQEAAPDVVRIGRCEKVDILEAARTCSRIHLSPAGAEFSVTASGGSHYVLGDPNRLEQVLMNLYGNALEAGARRVTTQIRRIGGEVEIAIEDDGRGCAPDQALRIFHPGHTPRAVRKARARSQAKRGLGLAIVRSIVENHGGRIRANVKNGRGDGETGLVIYLNLPAHVPLSGPPPALRSPIARRVPHPANASWDPRIEKAAPPL